MLLTQRSYTVLVFGRFPDLMAILTDFFFFVVFLNPFKLKVC
jgi:hypothetical protein